MDDLDFVVGKLDQDGKEKWPAVATAAGIPFNTLLKIARRTTKNPRWQTLAPLIEYYRAHDERTAKKLQAQS